MLEYLSKYTVEIILGLLTMFLGFVIARFWKHYPKVAIYATVAAVIILVLFGGFQLLSRRFQQLENSFSRQLDSLKEVNSRLQDSLLAELSDTLNKYPLRSSKKTQKLQPIITDETLRQDTASPPILPQTDSLQEQAPSSSLSDGNTVNAIPESPLGDYGIRVGIDWYTKNYQLIWGVSSYSLYQHPTNWKIISTNEVRVPDNAKYATPFVQIWSDHPGLKGYFDHLQFIQNDKELHLPEFACESNRNWRTRWCQQTDPYGPENESTCREKTSHLSVIPMGYSGSALFMETPKAYYNVKSFLYPEELKIPVYPGKMVTFSSMARVTQ